MRSVRGIGQEVVMRRRTFAMVLVLFALTVRCYAFSLQGVVDGARSAVTSKFGNANTAAGLQEVLKVAVTNMVNQLGKKDGFASNPAIKVTLPPAITKFEPMLRQAGLGSQLDSLTKSMNAAAEQSVPVASGILGDAITKINFPDATSLLQGSNTAITDYFKSKTYDSLLAVFKQSVSKAMAQNAVASKYQGLMSSVQALPIANQMLPAFDLNTYVSSKALDGMFAVMGQQEVKLRTDPSLRTGLLKTFLK